MPDDYLPPVVTRLTGDISDLAKKYAEADALAQQYAAKTEKTLGDAGTASGKAMGENFTTEASKTDPAKVTDPLGTGLKDKFGGEGKKSGKQFGTDFAAAAMFGIIPQEGEVARRSAAMFGNVADDLARDAEVQARWTKLGEGLGDNTSRGVLSRLKSAFGDWTKAFSEEAVTASQKAAKDLGASVTSSGSSALMGMFAAAAPVLVPAAVLLGAEVGSMFAGAVTGAVGAGGVGIGLIEAFKDPRVKAEASKLGKDLQDNMSKAGQAFAGPVTQALEALDVTVGKDSNRLAAAIEPLAKAVIPLEQGIAGFADKFLPGLERAFHNAEPVLEQFGKDLPGLGTSLGDFFAKISNNTGANTSAIHEMFTVVEDTVNVVGTLIQGMQKLWTGTVQVGTAFADLDTKWMGWMPGLGDYLKSEDAKMHGLKDTVSGTTTVVDAAGKAFAAAQPFVGNLTGAIIAQKLQVDALTNAWDKWYGVSMGVDQANLTLHQDVTALTDSIAQHGHQWDLDTKAGQANYGALLQAIQGAHDYRQAQIDSGVSSAQANKTYTDTVNKLLDVAAKAGLSSAQVQSLKAQVNGLAGALNSINGKVYSYTIWAKQVASGDTLKHGLAGGGLVRDGQVYHAAGGWMAPSAPGTLVMAGEPSTGGEWLIPSRGISRGTAAALGAGAMAGYGLDVVPRGTGGNAGGGGGSVLMQPIYLVLDGRIVYQAIIPLAQERKTRTGTTGLG
jgi:hypothetical protein